MAHLHWEELRAAARPTDDPARDFDGHVLACILGIAIDEVASGTATLPAATGLDAATLDALFTDWFPTFDPTELRRADPGRRRRHVA